MNKKLILFVLVAMVVTALVPVAAQDDNTITFAPGEPIRLGLATDLSNIIPAPGLDIANGGQLAVDLANTEDGGLGVAGGGVEGFAIELVIEDDRCTGEDATTVANKFASDETIVGVVGHVCSGASIPASEIYQDARIPMVSPSSTAGAFTARGLDVTNRVAFSDNIQGVVAARYIAEELGAESIAILHDNSSYGEGLASTVRDTLEEIGVEIVTFEVVDPEEQDYRPVLTVIAGDAPDVVYLGGYQNQAALLVEQMAEVGLDATFFSDDGVYTQDFLELAGDFAEGSYVSFGEQAGDEGLNEEFDALYEESFGEAPDDLGPFHAQSFDSAVVLIEAIRAVAEIDDDGNLTIDREALIAAVKEVTFDGISGVVACSDVGECGTVVIDILIAEDGEWVSLDVPEELQVSEGE